jgi:hypothetical protein
MARGFHKGSSGSPFQTEYYGTEGIDTGPGGKPSEEMPRIGAGVLGRRVQPEMSRTMRGSRRNDTDKSGQTD